MLTNLVDAFVQSMQSLGCDAQETLSLVKVRYEEIMQKEVKGE